MDWQWRMAAAAARTLDLAGGARRERKALGGIWKLPHLGTAIKHATPIYIKQGYILGLCVSPSHRRMGTGTTLVRRMEEWFCEWEADLFHRFGFRLGFCGLHLIRALFWGASLVSVLDLGVPLLTGLIRALIWGPSLVSALDLAVPLLTRDRGYRVPWMVGTSTLGCTPLIRDGGQIGTVHGQRGIG